MCLFCSEVEYILWTHTEGSKIHDELLIQNCFKPNEDRRETGIFIVGRTIRDTQGLPYTREKLTPQQLECAWVERLNFLILTNYVTWACGCL